MQVLTVQGGLTPGAAAQRRLRSPPGSSAWHPAPADNVKEDMSKAPHAAFQLAQHEQIELRAAQTSAAQVLQCF